MSIQSQPPNTRGGLSRRDSTGRTSPESIHGLANSSNMFAAGIGEALQAFLATAKAPNARPITVEFGSRVMAVGRQRMLAMNGRNALLYMKSKFGLLNSTTALYLQATFEGDEERFVEVDLDSWEELVVYMQRLRIIT
ncbi:hypothetical protein JR316_0002383 [Psilocybe cubensis]|uniref:Uncharacterized protein n=2 Tax=Psilocybe cubensis TaxID=181762 RepID=A0A8H8CPI2_PSICU|nr:hypothetical protein JR316_0002383 [Psilocybe cubensis]KAH9485475.1 hypothetical protein JR316_0002383 [Psilocybe cubensis]